MAQPSFVKSIQMPGMREPIELATPPSQLGGVINVVCGANNSGKTYLLDRLRQLLVRGPRTDTAPADDVRVALTNDGAGYSQPRVLPLVHAWQEKLRAGHVYAGMKASKLRTPTDIPPYRTVYLALLGRLIASHTESPFDRDRWLRDPELRRQTVSVLRGEDTAYVTSREDVTVRSIETLLAATLCFRRAKSVGSPASDIDDHMEFMITYADGSTVPYDEWSDGQKHIFYIVALLVEEKPDIVLVDEIETHLHPEHISRLLDFLRRNIPQTIVATHHPHVIFSEFADRVLFIETAREEPLKAPPATIPHYKDRHLRKPVRAVSTLESSFAKIAAVYKLFSHQDNQLLRLATWVSVQADLIIYAAVRSAFEEEIVLPSTSTFPDKQTRLLANEIRTMVDAHDIHEPIRVLDIGAGVARVAAEIGKLRPWRIAPMYWFAWEPTRSRRANLRDSLEACGIPGEAPESLSEVRDRSIHIALFANVLHHLQPSEAATLLCDVDRVLIRNTGILVFLEVHPLLRAEKFAVPYPPDTLASLLNDIGFASRSQTVPVYGHVSRAYAVIARRLVSGPPLDPALVGEIIRRRWDDIEKLVISDYASRSGVLEVEDHQAVLQDLTTIASLVAYRRGLWPKLE